MGVYLDWRDWPGLFPLTIAAVKLLRDDGRTLRLEVSHKKQGKVVNVLRPLPSSEVELREWKKRYDARFVNRFEAAGAATRYTLVAEVALKGWYRLLALFVKPYMRWQMRHYVAAPLKRRVEALQPGAPGQAHQPRDASAP